MKRTTTIKFSLISCICIVAITAHTKNLAEVVKHIKDAPSINELVDNIQTVKLPNDISCLIIDLKYRKNTVKILELGEINRSQVSGYDKLYGTGTIWRKMWHELASYKQPIWYIQKEVTHQKEVDKFGYDEFITTGTRLYHDLQNLEMDIKPTSTTTGIVVMRPIKEELLPRKDFKEKYPNILFLNAASALFASNKYLLNLIMKDPILEQFRPTTKVYQKKYSPELATTILQTFGNTPMVIKPLNSANGWGVIICDHKTLDRRLKTILQEPHKLRTLDDKAYSYWADDKNKSFIVQRYEPSDPLTMNENTYDATMRVVVFLSHIDGKFRLSFLGSYWKLPQMPLEGPGSLLEKHKSNVHQKGLISSAKLSKKDEQNVYEKLKDVVQLMYFKMLYIKGKTIDDISKGHTDPIDDDHH